MDKKEQLASYKDRLSSLRAGLKSTSNPQTRVAYKEEILALKNKIEALEKKK